MPITEYRKINPKVLPEPHKFQADAVNIYKLTADERALQFAYSLSCLTSNDPRPDLSSPGLKPYYAVPIPGTDGEFVRYIAEPDSADLGVILTSMDLATDLRGRPLRLELEDGKAIPYIMGDLSIKMALAVRAQEFQLFHNPQMYDHLRALKSGTIKSEPRSNTKSAVIEEVLGIIRNKEYTGLLETDMSDDEIIEVIATDVIQRVGYARRSANTIMSRTKAATEGLFLTSTGIPSSIYALGGMPPVTGWEDVGASAALVYTRSWIPRNSLFVEPDRQLKMFKNIKRRIEELGLPSDIADICIRQVGVCVGCENPDEIAQYAAKAYDEGCRAIRIYTTNPDPRTIRTAEAIRQKVGEDMVICVAPIVDMEQAHKLTGRDIKANILLAGHGAGENCTSLAAGGAANGLELVYRMSLEQRFNNTAIGFEGGAGPAIGGFLGMIDVISMNRRGVGGGIETGGLFVQHVNGRAVQPYHGSASAITQWLEAVTDPQTAVRRLSAAGMLLNVEGKPGYMHKSKSVNSMFDNLREARMYAGRALADQDSLSIQGLRRNIANWGNYNHRIVTPEALVIAGPHGANS